MSDAITHRGPDGEGIFVDKDVGLAFRRLSILDLSSAGDQPMHSADGRYTVVFNGEIYNYIELRKELQSLGHRFRSSGDTEVLLNAYIEWGADCVSRFNGMWAFVIFDKHSRSLFVSRDRFGVKPLYWYQSGNAIIFASQIISICRSGYYDSQVNWSIAGRFLTRGALDESDDSFYRDIRKFPAGSYGTVGPDREIKTTRFWALREDLPAVGGDAGGQFAELFEDSVALRLRSDVPVGVLLSGGLDSTSIICSVSRAKSKLSADKREATAAFSYNDVQFDESALVTDTIAQTGAQLIKLDTNPEALWSDLDQLIAAHDEPAHSASALIGYKLMQLAADNGVKVVLNGQGADETLAGYPNYFENYWITMMLGGKLGNALKQISEFKEHYGGRTSALMMSQVGQIVRGMLSHIPMYRAVGRMLEQRDIRKNDWYSQDFLGKVTPPDRKPLRLELDDALEDSVETFPLPLYLRVEDRNSMAHSVEARLPFMDYRLVKFAFALSAPWKMKGPLNKYILREAMLGKIPESVRTRKEKFGFPTPIDRWVREPMRDSFCELFASQEIQHSGILKMNNIQRDFQRHLRGEINIGARLFNVVQFHKWLKISNVGLG